jgi:flagellar basal body-associated protein FliL
MADQPDGQAAQGKKGFPKKTLIIVLGIALVQGAAFFAVYKFAGGSPQAAHGQGSHVVEGDAADKPVGVAEITLLRNYKVPNQKSGKTIIYDLDISVVVSADREEEMEELVGSRGGEIADRISHVMRSATVDMLREDDGLLRLKAQIAKEVAEMAEDDELILRVLIPRFVPIPG